MRTYKEVTRQYTEQVLDKTTCDLCGRVAKYGRWGSSVYEINETEVTVKVGSRTGTNYPEGGSATEVTFDICPKCFEEKLVPAIKAMGAEPLTKESDW